MVMHNALHCTRTLTTLYHADFPVPEVIDTLFTGLGIVLTEELVYQDITLCAFRQFYLEST